MDKLLAYKAIAEWSLLLNSLEEGSRVVLGESWGVAAVWVMMGMAVPVPLIIWDSVTHTITELNPTWNIKGYLQVAELVSVHGSS